MVLLDKGAEEVVISRNAQPNAPTLRMTWEEEGLPASNSLMEPGDGLYTMVCDQCIS